MANENQGPAVSPQVRQKAERGGTQARKAAEDLGSAAGAMANKYLDRAEEVWDDSRDRVRSFQDDSKQYIREEPEQGGLYRAWGRFRARFNFSSLRTVDARGTRIGCPSLSSRPTSKRCFRLLWQ